MESVYDLPMNDLINIKEFFKKYSEVLEKYPLPSNDEEVKVMMKFQGSEEEFENLKKSIFFDVEKDSVPIIECDPGKYYRSTIVNSLINIPVPAFELETSKELLAYRSKIVSRHGTKKVYPFGRTEFNYHLIKNVPEPLSINEENLIPFCDVSITVRIYRPFCYGVSLKTSGPSFQEEFLVFGDQYLTDLRDNISCEFNERCIFDISSNLERELPKQQAKPGFFFITNTFYNDTRDPNNPDYSENIKTWLEGETTFRGKEFKTAKMEETKFSDLDIRLGFPQVYQHNGNCEHLFCFSSIQILTQTDHLKKSQYPVLTSASIPKYSNCNMCGNSQFSYIIKDSNKQLSDPAFLCDPCLRNYHYIDGKKIGEFKAYLINEIKVEDSDEDIDTDEKTSSKNDEGINSN
ncbi:snRNA-activating protein complex subunit 3 [Condylostylus longicornis]|uniref:snRNA-activating protein complex subunit 3 n=1 Tax=Condylostylus longicornis TaxID=2530218 RepID=UPI00244DC978|nr:snRNA-activating protein complex subunit 3 [Condylostylus longicornis]